MGKVEMESKVDLVGEILEQEAIAKNPIAKIEPDGAGSLLTIIEKIAQMPEIDMDRVERVFAMHQQMQDRQSEQAFNDAMSMAQNKIQSVLVNRENEHTKVAYADLDAIHKAAKPCWTRHGFSVMTRDRAASEPGFLTVTTEIRHSAGHKEVLESDWPLDIAGKDGTKNKTPIQAKGSTIQYARRYNELSAFDVAVSRDDNDGNARSEAKPNTISEIQVRTLMGLIMAAKTTPEQFCKKTRINMVHELQESRFEAAVNGLKAQIEKAAS